ncbi:sugar ABC transporter permease [Prosthecomicrobium hirschii]|uniref:ABC transporter permease n=1 Tax=Prosthecodimorpha hirschii TaxID=665126 RepID=UPI00112DF49F|nr:ABC transporter permease [Prosthecomicrobium hirschii]TPQ45705.1 sugar ABC transporter permease [Prosthecomicrobium hirschii]
MRIELEKRPERAEIFAWASPLIAVALTVVTGGLIFALAGINPLKGLYVFFIEPFTSLWSIEELIVKATPLVLIGVGLSIAYRANVWNIGAEGQFTMGAIFGAAVPILLNGWNDPSTLVAMLVLGTIGGMVWGAIPALLKVRFGANEILTSLMLVYVSQLLLDWLVRGIWRDPKGFNFPKSVGFDGWQTMPVIGDGRVNLGTAIALAVAVLLAVLMSRTLKGFEVRVLGQAPRAGRFAGFSSERMVVFAFLLSGGLAGLAGIMEVASTIGQLQPNISPGYGFTAIIVAFLGRLNPIGVIFAGIVLAVSYLGGEAAQVGLGISDKTARVFQGILLFYILACDTLILYRIKLVGRAPAEARAHA